MIKKITLATVTLEWLYERKKGIKESSYLKYFNIINNYINPNLGTLDFKKLSNNDILSFFNKKNISMLSDSTKTLILIILKSTIKYGISKNYRKHFDIVDIKIKKPKSKIIYFTKKEQEILNTYLKNNICLNNLGILIALYTGIRLGELCGIKKKDIDFINETLTINRTIQRIKNTDNYSKKKTKLIVSTPKTESSIRVIPLPNFLIKFIKIYTEDIINDDFFLFTNSLTPKDPRAFEKYFSRLLDKLKIKKLNFHSLRHTFATRSREAGIDIKILSELLGHSTYKVTLDIYVHTSIEFKKDSINSLVKYLDFNNS